MQQSAASPNAFLSEAAEGSMAEIQTASLALTRTQNPEVRTAAQQIIADHTAVSDEVKSIAGKKSAQTSLEISSAHKSVVNKLTKLQGAEFDREFVKAMVEDHEKDVKAFADADSLSKSAKHKEAFTAFDSFLKEYPTSRLAPDALYGMGYSQFALKNYKSSIATQQKLVDLHPDSVKVADAMFYGK